MFYTFKSTPVPYYMAIFLIGSRLLAIGMANPKADRLIAYTRLTQGSRDHQPTPPQSGPQTLILMTRLHQEDHSRSEILTEATPPKGQLPTVPLFSGSRAL